MSGAFRFPLRLLALLGPLLAFVGCGGPTQPTRPTTPAPKPPPAQVVTPKPPEAYSGVMLGIDVLEAEGFAAVRGKRLGLLTHPAGVNRHGVSTIEVLRKAPGVQLVALFAVEHGIYGDAPAEKPQADTVDPRTGLKVFSLYKGNLVKATPAQLKLIDAFVIDLQDIGTRSYTYIGAMKLALEACFEAGKEVIILDRPNPLGGLKVSGPPLDAELMSDVGRFRVPYVHGLTMGELARMAVASQPPGGIKVGDAARANGKLTVIAMRNWSRRMRWTETGLPFLPTSPGIRDFAAVQGYPMTGLGCIIGGFSHGVGYQHNFRGVSHPRIPIEALEKDLRALSLPGMQFRRISVPNAKSGKAAIGLYIEITDYDDWQPCDLNFWLMKLACKYEPKNPFATATPAKQREFKVHVGSAELLTELATKGARIDIEAKLKTWREQARIFQEQSKRFWLYR